VETHSLLFPRRLDDDIIPDLLGLTKVDCVWVWLCVNLYCYAIPFTASDLVFDSELIFRALDAMLMRKKIATDLGERYQDKYSMTERDDIIQRLIDRLIFMRKCEDTQINPDNIVLLERLGYADSRTYSKLKDDFAVYDREFNSGLFKPNYDNDCDNVVLDGAVIKELIGLLYESRDHQYQYNFSWIDADILGQVYEQYLGQILAETKSGRTKLKGGQPHKREQGIYYTPTPVVEYIVRNTLGDILKNKKAEEIRKIKVLDPTCGSGSFLIKAFDDIETAYETKGGQLRLNLGSAILVENIFGVDLDEKAVEIASLNLLLRAAETKHKLPELGNNLKCGNSFIDDESVAGLKAFNWETRFPAVFSEGRFDVIVGNPPYVHQKGGKGAPKIAYAEREYFRRNYRSVHSKNVKSRGGIKLNLFVPYVERSIGLLNPNGVMGFIVHKNLLKVESYKLLRKFILDNCIIEQIVDLGAGVFPEVTGETVIVILKKERNPTNRNKHRIRVRHNLTKTSDLLDGKGTETTIEQEKFQHSIDNMFSIYVDDKIESLKEKLWQDSRTLDSAAKIVSFGLNTIDNKKFVVETKINDKYKPAVMGRDIGKWTIKNLNRFVLYDPKILDRAGDVEAFNSPEKLIFQRIGTGLVGAYDTGRRYCFNSTNMLLPKKTRNKTKTSLKYLLGLLNSKLLNFYYRAVFSTESSLTVNVTQGYLSQMPIRNPTANEQRKVVELVDRLISLSKRLNELGDKKTHETATLTDEMNKTDTELDELVFDLYDLNEDEKKLVRGSIE